METLGGVITKGRKQELDCEAEDCEERFLATGSCEGADGSSPPEDCCLRLNIQARGFPTFEKYATYIIKLRLEPSEPKYRSEQDKFDEEAYDRFVEILLEIYERLEKLGLPAEEIIRIGDDIQTTTYLKGAHGWKGLFGHDGGGTVAGQ